VQYKFSGTKVRDCRLAAGLSQEGLARVIPVSQVTIWRWESGRDDPVADTLPSLADALGVAISDLYAADEPVPA
jgi:transcriptional regulator with XRE-family HTH domain